jgi:hypothetical protein
MGNDLGVAFHGCSLYENSIMAIASQMPAGHPNCLPNFTKTPL